MMEELVLLLVFEFIFGLRLGQILVQVHHVTHAVEECLEVETVSLGAFTLMLTLSSEVIVKNEYEAARR